MEDVIKLVTELVEPLAESLGYELVEVSYKNNGYGEFALTLFIDNENGISLADCEALHKLADSALDELDPTKGSPYVLNVSSSGLDRPILTNRDYTKNLGKGVEISLFKKIEEGKKFVATLDSFNLETGEVTVKFKNKAIKLELKNISKITPEIKF